MKKITFLVFIFLFISCETEYNGEKRFVVEGKLVNSEGVPITEREILIYKLYNYDGDEKDLISRTFSNENGNFTVVFPAPKNNFAVELDINENDLLYQEKIFSYLLEDDFENFKLDLNEILLYGFDEITNLYITTNHVSNDTALRSIEITALKPDELIDYNPENQNLNYPQTEFTIIKNQNFVLRYTVIDYQTYTVSAFLVDLSVENEPISYEITY